MNGPAISRRGTLQAAGFLGAGYFSGLANAASQLANADLRVGVLGVGNHGATNLAAVAKEASIAALCDVDSRYLAPIADRHATAQVFRDPREMFAADLDLDAVVISTPDHTHAWAALTAMAKGWHVFCEKPLTHNVAELQRLVKAAESKKVATQTGMQHWVQPGTRQAIAALQGNILGEIREIHAWTDRPIWPQGMAIRQNAEEAPESLLWEAWLGPAPMRAYHSDYHPLRWRGWWDFGGGALGDFGPHLLAAVFWGLNLPAPAEIMPESGQVRDGIFPQSSRIRFTFAETKERAPLELVWNDGGKLPPRDVLAIERPPPNGVLVVGERGKLFLPDYGRAPQLLGVASKQTRLPKARTVLDSLHRNWIECCKRGEQPYLPFAAATPLMETCLLGNIALRVGERLQWNPDSRTLLPEGAQAFLSAQPREGWEFPSL